MRIAVATSTRADWGLLSPLAEELRQRGHQVEVMATNMHLDARCGMTVTEIEADGFSPVRIPASGTPAEVAADVLRGFGNYFATNNFDAIIILGDRYEMLSAASAALLAGIPIVHIAGGAVSEGAFDDGFRHAITKLSMLHLAETDEYAARIIHMGEDPQRVITTGAIGIHNILNTKLLSREELDSSLNFTLGENAILVTLHAATLSPLPAEEQMGNLIAALEYFTELRIIFSYPNNDVDPAPLISQIERLAVAHPDRVLAIPSLGRLRYLSALQYVKAVVGNSSSGLVEVPSMHIPTLDIGCRQNGRLHGPSVVRCGETVEEIREGIERVLSPEQQEIARTAYNPYARPETLRRMADAIEYFNFTPYPVKKFYD